MYREKIEDCIKAINRFVEEKGIRFTVYTPILASSGEPINILVIEDAKKKLPREHLIAFSNDEEDLRIVKQLLKAILVSVCHVSLGAEMCREELKRLV